MGSKAALPLASPEPLELEGHSALCAAWQCPLTECHLLGLQTWVLPLLLMGLMSLLDGILLIISAYPQLPYINLKEGAPRVSSLPFAFPLSGKRAIVCMLAVGSVLLPSLCQWAFWG